MVINDIMLFKESRSFFLFLANWVVWSSLSWILWFLSILSPYKPKEAEFIHSNKSFNGCLLPVLVEWALLYPNIWSHLILSNKWRNSYRSKWKKVLIKHITFRLEKWPCLPNLLLSASRNISSVTLPTFMQASSRIAMIPLCCCSTRSTMIWLLK